MPLPEFDAERANERLKAYEDLKDAVARVVELGAELDERWALKYARDALIQAGNACWARLNEHQAKHSTE